MKKSLYLIAGILIGITLFGGSSVLAAGITAERSTNHIYVNGQEVHLTAYNINGNNYVMLRDVGKTVGFEVYWDGDAKCVQVESGKPYTGEASVTSAEAKPVEQPAQTDVAAAKQDIIDRTNALRKENGVDALRVNNNAGVAEHGLHEIFKLRNPRVGQVVYYRKTRAARAAHHGGYRELFAHALHGEFERGIFLERLNLHVVY